MFCAGEICCSVCSFVWMASSHQIDAIKNEINQFHGFQFPQGICAFLVCYHRIGWLQSLMNWDRVVLRSVSIPICGGL